MKAAPPKNHCRNVAVTNSATSPRNIDFTSSMFNSITRSGDLGLSMEEKDLEVFETERLSSCATVLMIDVSHSMVLYGEDRITPAKQVAMAFTELILTKYPKDDLSIVLFGDDAKQVQITDLPYIGAGPVSYQYAGRPAHGAADPAGQKACQ